MQKRSINMDKHPIDRLFKDKLDSHEWAFSQSAWDDALILLRSQKRRKRKLIVLWWTFGVISLLGISGLAWTLLRESSQNPRAMELVAAQELSSEAELTKEPSLKHTRQSDMEATLPSGTAQIENVDKQIRTAKPQLEENQVTLHNPKANDMLTSASHQDNKDAGTPDILILDNRSDIDITFPSNLTFSERPVAAIATLLNPVKWNDDLDPSVASIVPVVSDIIFPTQRTTGGLVSGLAITFLTDVNPGLLSNDEQFHDHSLRIGFQQAFSPYFAAEIRGGSRFFSGELPVHAQTAQVSYAIGSETTTFQLKADQLIMAGVGLALHSGYRKHRLSVALDVDRVIAAHGIIREQLFVQERRLQDRTAKPVTVSEQRTWIDTKGISPWNYSTEFSYRFAISPKLELGVAWIHRYQELVINDEYYSDRLSFTAKKIF